MTEKTKEELVWIIEEAEDTVRTLGDPLFSGSSRCKSLRESNKNKCPKACRSLLGCKKVRKLVQLWVKDIFEPTLENQIILATNIEDLDLIQLPEERKEYL